MAKIVTEKEHEATKEVEVEKKATSTSSNKASKEKEKPEESTSKKFSYEYECGFAPMGKSRVPIKIDGKFKNLDLENRIYKIPKGTSKEERAKITKALLEAGFRDVSSCKGAPFFNKQTGEWIYRAVHTDHSKNKPVNCNISLFLYEVGGKPSLNKDGTHEEIQISVINGLVKTTDIRVFNALLKAGFSDAGKIKKKEEVVDGKE